MNKKIINDVRKIKNNNLEIKPNNSKLNPLTLTMDKNNNDTSLYFTKYSIDDGQINNLDLKSSNLNLYLNPPLLLSDDSILKIYNIYDINDIIKLIENSNYYSINRILNAYIRINFKEFKKNNKILSSIYNKIFDKYFEMNSNIKDLDKFIQSWFQKNDQNNFILNLGNDLKYYLSKKYEQ